MTKSSQPPITAPSFAAHASPLVAGVGTGGNRSGISYMKACQDICRQACLIWNRSRFGLRCGPSAAANVNRDLHLEPGVAPNYSHVNNLNTPRVGPQPAASVGKSEPPVLIWNRLRSARHCGPSAAANLTRVLDLEPQSIRAALRLKWPAWRIYTRAGRSGATVAPGALREAF
jgi:hypothetical protein